ncbi:type II secretion system protein [Mesoaciditoga sp.]
MKGFTLIELLIVMAVIAALISAMVPIGTKAIREARATAIALDLSELSKAVMDDFYVEQNFNITMQDLKGYFQPDKDLSKFKIKTSLTNDIDQIYIWYTGNDVTASQVEKVFPDVEASGEYPMIHLSLEKYW